MNRFKYPLAAAAFILAASVGADEITDQKTCLNQLRELASLNLSFAASHDGQLPKTLDELLSVQKTSDRSLFIAPLAADKSRPSYELLLPGERLSRIGNPARTISIRAVYSFKDGRRLAAFVDGHVEILDAKR
jgi:prepilin-type processing-associated H-X9-DG protein